MQEDPRLGGARFLPSVGRLKGRQRQESGTDQAVRIAS